MFAVSATTCVRYILSLSLVSDWLSSGKLLQKVVDICKERYLLFDAKVACDRRVKNYFRQIDAVTDLTENILCKNVVEDCASK